MPDMRRNDFTPAQVSTSHSTVRIRVSGRVQGVGYRYFAQAKAASLGLCGWVRNTPDGAVECYVEGPKKDIEMLIQEFHKGPSLARIEHVYTEWQVPSHIFSEFSIRA